LDQNLLDQYLLDQYLLDQNLLASDNGLWIKLGSGRTSMSLRVKRGLTPVSLKRRVRISKGYSLGAVAPPKERPRNAQGTNKMPLASLKLPEAASTKLPNERDQRLNVATTGLMDRSKKRRCSVTSSVRLPALAAGQQNAYPQ
jgi:hypothetical protein